MLIVGSVEALYRHVYTIKFLPKSHLDITGFEPFSVAPLEGSYGNLEEGWDRTLVIAVPHFVTREVIELARSK